MLEALLMIGKKGLTSTTTTLLHMDGAQGSATVVDVYGRHIVNQGGGRITTVQSKFGGSSFGFSSNYSDCLLIPNDASVQMTGDFTIEYWSYLINFSNYDSMAFSKRASNGINTSAGYLELYQGTAYLKLDGEPQPATKIANAGFLKAAQWQHIALTRQNNLYTLWVDGVAAGSRTSTNTFGVNDGDFLIGNWAATASATPFVYNGYIDEFRSTKGTALYTTPFTPPSAPFAA